MMVKIVNRLFFIFCFCCLYHASNGQDVAPRIFLQNTYDEDVPTIYSFSDYFSYWHSCTFLDVPENRFSDAPVTKKFKSDCFSGQGMVYFFIDSSGKVDKANIGFSNTLNQNLQDLMTELLIYSDGLWTPRKVNGKACRSKQFVLPVNFLDVHCEDNKEPSSDSFVKIFHYLTQKVVTSPDKYFEFPSHYLLQPISLFRER